MKVLFDTTFLIDLERENKKALELAEYLATKQVPMIISTVTISELLAGAYSSKKMEKSVKVAKDLLAEFSWVDIDGFVAEEIAKVLAYRREVNKPVTYTDAAVIASFLATSADYLVTDNLKDFDSPNLEGKVYTPKEFLRALKEKKLKFV